MPAPSLTVLLTVYNGMPYLEQAVESILRQSLRDFHFLILNNGSTDGTGAWLDTLERSHQGAPSLEIVRLEENIGRTAVLNRGLARIRSELVAVIDADDVAEPDRLERQAAFLRDREEVVLVGSDVVYIDATGNVIGRERFATGHEELCNKLPLNNQFAHAACAFRAEAARRAGGYPERYPYAQDLGLWIAMLARGGKAASIPEPLARIRAHPGQASRSLELLMVRAKDNHGLALAMLGIPGLSKAARQAARLRAAGALFGMGRSFAALAEAWRGVMEGPLLLPCNPILWKRLRRELVGLRK